jgi:hypothetical protein
MTFARTTTAMARSDAMTRTNTASQRMKGAEMKKFLVGLALLVGLFSMVPSAFAVHANDDAVTQSLWCSPTGVMCVFTFSWTGDSTDGVVDADSASGAVMTTANFTKVRGYFAYPIITDPGSTSPTAAYDITLPDSSGLDLAGGLLADRSATATQRIVPKVDTTNSIYGGTPLLSPITLTITNQSVNSATGTVTIVLWRE